jgi:hypothetical protein
MVEVVSRHLVGVDMVGLINAFETGELRLIEEVVDLNALARVLRDELGPAWSAALRRGSEHTLRELNLSLDADFRIAPFVLAWAEQNAVNLVVDVTARTREGLRATVLLALRDGLGPREAAQRLIQVNGFGLTFRQSVAVDNFRRGLERAIDLGTDPHALVRDFRLARDVLRPRQRFTRGDIARLTRQYRDRSILHRAHTIARSESIRAFSMGRISGWLKGAERGAVTRDDKQVQWLVTPDERTCPICLPMHGQLRDIGQTFTAGNGTEVLVPGDTHPSCRCTVILVARGTVQHTDAGVRTDEFVEDRLAELELDEVG